MRSFFVSLVVFGIVGYVGGLQEGPKLQASSAAVSTDELKPLPELKLMDLDGKAMSADALKGSVIVLDFWATWCGPCISEIPILNGLQQKYADKGLKVVGVTMASGEPGEVKPFISKNRMHYTVLMGDDNQANDFVIAFPTTYLLTRDLKIYQKYLGAGPRKLAALDADIRKLIESGN